MKVYAIKSNKTGLYYKGHHGRFGESPKIYVHKRWAKSAIACMRRSDCSIVEWDSEKIAKFSLYKWRGGENSTLFVNGQYKASFLSETPNLTDIHYWVDEKTPMVLEVFELWEDDDKEIYFDKEESENEADYIKWMETH